jgi:type VI secretion system protein ImpA
MITDALERLADVVSYLGGDRLTSGDTAGTGVSEAAADNPVERALDSRAANVQAQPAGAITSREDAIARLRAVSRYFRETEPHSPISYSLQNIIRWSQLPLDKLIEEWIQDSDARERYMLMTGMRLQEGQEDD